MNFLAGGLLVFCPEDVAFWMLTSIVDELLNEYFCETMTGSIADWYFILLFEYYICFIVVLIYGLVLY